MAGYQVPRHQTDQQSVSRTRSPFGFSASLSLLLSLLFLFPALHAAAEIPAQEVQPSIVGVNGYRGTTLESRGTGFVVRSDDEYGHVVTSSGLVLQGGTITVSVPDTGAELIAVPEVVDGSAGFALLRVNGLDRPAFTFGDDRVEQGSLVWSADYLARDASAVSIAKGSVSRTYVVPTASGELRMLIHNAVISDAGIGAPILNECAEVIGLTISAPDPDTGVAYALRGGTLITLLRRAAVVVAEASSTCLSLLEQARRDAENASAKALEAKDEANRALSTAARLEQQLREVNQLNEALQRDTREAQTRAEQAIEEASGAREDAEAARAEVDRRTSELQSETKTMLQALEEGRRLSEAQMKARLEAQRTEAEQREVLYWGGFAALGVALGWLVFLFWRHSQGESEVEPAAERTPTHMQRPDLTEYILDGEDENGIRYLLRISGDQLSSPQGAVIGRNPPDSPYVINHSDVSRKHARLRLIKNRLFIEDLGSTNGTTVNGQSIDDRGSVTLANGDQIIMGSVVLRLRSIPAA